MLASSGFRFGKASTARSRLSSRIRVQGRVRRAVGVVADVVDRSLGELELGVETRDLQLSLSPS